MGIDKNHYIDVDVNHDFGFTFADEEDITKPVYSSLNEQVDDLKKRLQAVEKMFMPFLTNLSRDPDKAMIKWPNRAEMIDKQIKKLKSLTNV
jgi:hypothetical protein